MYNMEPYQQGRVAITKAIFAVTGTHNDMTLRPYETHMGGSLINEMQEVTRQGSSISPSVLSGVANQFLRPSAQPQDSIMIDNGWGTPRLRFIFEVSYYDANNDLTNRKILQGYTDYAGVSSQSGAMDPRMTMFFNTVLSLRQSVVMTPSGQSLKTHVESANHLLRGYNDYDFATGQGRMTQLMRPEDLFHTLNATALDSDDFVDLRTTFNSEPVVKSRRRNNSAPFYVSGAVNAYRNTIDFADNGADYADMTNEARGQVQEDTMAGDKFFFMLKQHSNSFSQNGTVTYGEMCSMFPEFDHVAVVITHREIEQQNQMQEKPFATHQRGQTEYWTGSNNETVAASILSQSVPSIMMDLMLTRVVFSATNQTLDGTIDVRIMDARSFADGIDLSPYLDFFINRLTSEILRSLSRNNSVDFNLIMSADVLDDTRINLSIGGGYPTEFAAPSYGDALYTPVITNTQHHIQNVAYDVQQLATSVGAENIHRHGTNFTPTLQETPHDSIV